MLQQWVELDWSLIFGCNAKFQDREVTLNTEPKFVRVKIIAELRMSDSTVQETLIFFARVREKP